MEHGSWEQIGDEMTDVVTEMSNNTQIFRILVDDVIFLPDVL